MGVLDDAIREHLALRRKHGASDDELAQTEAEALGPARREVPAPPEQAEASPISDQSVDPGPSGVEPGRSELEPEPPPAAEPEPAPTLEPEATPVEPPPAAAAAGEPLDEPLADDEVPATELLQESEFHPPGANGSGSEAPLDSEPLGAEERPAEPEPEYTSSVEAAGPGTADEELPEEELLEDELAEDEALEEREPAAADEALDLEPDARGFDDPARSSRDALEAETVEHEPLADDDLEDPEYGAPTLDDEAGEPSASTTGSDEDVLEETPDFLRDTPEHERLWFEQKPPRDFDLDE